MLLLGVHGRGSAALWYPGISNAGGTCSLDASRLGWRGHIPARVMELASEVAGVARGHHDFRVILPANRGNED